MGILGLLTALSGCASTGRSTGAGQILSAEKASALAVGMPIASVREVFGQPVSVTEMEFGEAVGEPWTGLVYSYPDGRDPRFAHRKRYFQTRLVFAEVNGDTLLNHWVMEKEQVTSFVSKKTSRRSASSEFSPR